VKGIEYVKSTGKNGKKIAWKLKGKQKQKEKEKESAALSALFLFLSLCPGLDSLPDCVTQAGNQHASRRRHLKPVPLPT
jgi:hypothetical protein